MTRRFAVAALVASLGAGTPAAADDEVSLIARRDADRMATPWSVTALYGHGWLSGSRPDRDELDLQLYSRVSPELVLGGRVNGQRRPPDTDTTYGASFYWSPIRTLEWHGWFDYAPDPSFRPERTYATGVEWRAHPQVSLLLDVKRDEYTDGRVDQVIPGVSYWFSDETWFTVRYASGRAYDESDFHTWSFVLNAGMPTGGRLTAAYANGGDPDKELGIPGVIVTDTDTYVLFYRHPLRRDVDLLVGVEVADRTGSYTRTTASVGVTYRF